MEEINVLEILGKNMHDIRFQKNMSLQELAEKVNMDIETLRKFEAGEYAGATVQQYVKIAKALEVSFQKIIKNIQFTEY